MIELSLDYSNKLANQFIFMSTFLGGFSLTVIVALLSTETSDRITKNIFRAAITATAGFIVTVFAMTKILMMTTEGYPFKVTDGDLIFPKAIGFFSFLLAIISLIAIISLSGWTKSKSMGRFTTLIGIVTLILAFVMMS